MVYLVIIVSIYILINLCFVPFQYQYIRGLEEMKAQTGKSQGEMYDSLSAQNQMLHSNAQGNLFILPATLLAHYFYKKKRLNK